MRDEMRDTLKWVREKAKNSEKRKSHGTVSWFKDHNGLIYRYLKIDLIRQVHQRDNLLYQSVLEE